MLWYIRLERKGTSPSGMWLCIKVKIGALLSFVCLSVLSAPAASRSIEERGNIVVISDDGIRTQITSSGNDSQPDLAFDGTKVVFVRKVNQAEGKLYLADVHEPRTTRQLLKSSVTINGREFHEVFTPKFSPDGASVYFLIRFTDTTNAIVKVSLNRPVPQFVTTALSFQVVTSGRYRGDIIAHVRKASLAYGYYELFWLLTPEGKEIGVVGQDSRDVAFFLELKE
jgi:Tol biopolymer transport system component